MRVVARLAKAHDGQYVVVAIERRAKLALREVLQCADEFVWARDVIEYLYIQGEPASWAPVSSCAVVALDAYTEEPGEVEVDGTRCASSSAVVKCRR